MYPFTDNIDDSTSDKSLRQYISDTLDKLADPKIFSAIFPDGRIERLTTYESAIKLISENPAIVVRVD